MTKSRLDDIRELSAHPISSFVLSAIAFALAIFAVAYPGQAPGISITMPIVISLGAVSYIMMKNGAEKRKLISAYPNLPVFSTSFSPFDPINNDGTRNKKTTWKRPTETWKLVKAICNAETTHLVVTGLSGVGKSELFREHVNPNLQSDVYMRKIWKDIYLEAEKTGEAPANKIDKFKIIKFNIYSDRDFLKKFINDIRRECDVSDEKFSNFWEEITPYLKAGKTLQEAFNQPVDEKEGSNSPSMKYWKKIEAFFKEMNLESRKIVFVFDQIERLIHQTRLNGGLTADSRVSGTEAILFLLMLQFFRVRKNLRTVFILRAEYLFNIDYILQHIPSEGTAARPVISQYICTGINADEGDEVNAEVPKALEEIYLNVAAHGLEDYWLRFKEINGLMGRAYSNTFFVQLSGYMLVNFVKIISEGDVATKKIFLSKISNRNNVIRRYFELLIHTYVLESWTRMGVLAGFRWEEQREIFKTIMFTIAVENRLAGEPISEERLVLLSHLPKDEVTEAIKFLRKYGLLVAEHNTEGPYRLVHDIIADYAIESELFTTLPSLKDAIRGLVEGRAQDTELSHLPVFPKYWKDRISTWGAGFVTVFIFHGLFLLPIWPFSLCAAEVAFFQRPFFQENSDLFVIPFGVRACDDFQPLYFYRWAMESIWEMYIYVLSAGVFYCTTREHKFLRNLGLSLPMVGAALGILFSHSPVFFLVPLCGVGFLMAAFLKLGGRAGCFKGRYRKDCALWGNRTLINMVFTASLMALTAIFLWREERATGFFDFLAQRVQAPFQAIFDPPRVWLKDQLGEFSKLWPEQMTSLDHTSIALAWVIIANGLMLWFLWHITPEQQSVMATATKLSMFDKTCFDQKQMDEILKAEAS